jgi:hypothetical protein
MGPRAECRCSNATVGEKLLADLKEIGVVVGNDGGLVHESTGKKLYIKWENEDAVEELRTVPGINAEEALRDIVIREVKKALLGVAEYNCMG